MKKRVRAGLMALACILVLSVVSIYAIPKLRVSLFVHLYHEAFEEGMAAHQGVPADDVVILGYKSVNSWDGTHPMTELVIMSRGDTYYGCYYSPDDVPLAFQNTAAELMPSGSDRWTWRAEGDNRGETSKILGCWYFFKASF